jgi:biopolymer transport protein ExbD
VQGRQLSLERLKVLLAQESSKRPDMTVVIVSDQEAAIKQTIQVMDVCALAGASKVSIAAEQH